MDQVFVRAEVVPGEVAGRWRAAMERGLAVEARVSRRGESVLDGYHRRTASILVDESVVREVVERFEDLRGELETFFARRLGRCQAPVFLLYEPGDFFRPHSDNSGDPRQPEHILARRATVVLFLNSSRDAAGTTLDPGPQTFSGGELVLYRAMAEPTWEHFYDVVPAREGTLVSFLATVDHEVSEVTAGRRFAIATWFESPAELSAAGPDLKPPTQDEAGVGSRRG